jgi:hypothetical protein
LNVAGLGLQAPDLAAEFLHVAAELPQLFHKRLGTHFTRRPLRLVAFRFSFQAADFRTCHLSVFRVTGGLQMVRGLAEVLDFRVYRRGLALIPPRLALGNRALNAIAQLRIRLGDFLELACHLAGFLGFSRGLSAFHVSDQTADALGLRHFAVRLALGLRRGFGAPGSAFLCPEMGRAEKKRSECDASEMGSKSMVCNFHAVESDLPMVRL